VFRISARIVKFSVRCAFLRFNGEILMKTELECLVDTPCCASLNLIYIFCLKIVECFAVDLETFNSIFADFIRINFDHFGLKIREKLVKYLEKIRKNC
jgi:hypothetical protein